MILTVKDKDGKTFDSVESINFEFKVFFVKDFQIDLGLRIARRLFLSHF